MDIDTNNLEVKHNSGEDRFEVDLGDGKIGRTEYFMRDGTYVFVHTEIPPEFGGRGIADKIAKFALDYVQEQGGKVIARCPFMSKYIQRHKEYQPLLVDLLAGSDWLIGGETP
jgi:uncharacterized protein